MAVDYFEIRTQDALKQLFDATVAAYQDSLELTQIQFNAGIAADEAVAQAETQLEATQAEDTNLGIARAQFEHAIALLLGQPASTFSLPAEPLQANPPAIPFGIPSQILERRPDVAAAERLVAAGQCADRPRDGCVLSDGDVERVSRIFEHVDRELVRMAQPFLVGGADAGGDAL